ncbi:MAG: hypothetical protein HOK57_13250 [Planctomycetaceae bacterium]|nr:hypothetical protein [Planctomycetaceae bacterium]MBT7728016.1 hypothetical protein [Planctomycetaceae bacterium]
MRYSVLESDPVDYARDFLPSETDIAYAREHEQQAACMISKQVNSGLRLLLTELSHIV